MSAKLDRTKDPAKRALLEQRLFSFLRCVFEETEGREMILVVRTPHV